MDAEQLCEKIKLRMNTCHEQILVNIYLLFETFLANVELLMPDYT